MTHRLTGTVIWTLVLVLLLLPMMAGCARSTSSQTTPSSPPAVTLAPSTVSIGLARIDPAVWAAVRFEQAHCSWDWHRPLTTYLTAQQALATPEYGKQLAASANPASWREEVVAGQQKVSCKVSAPHRLVGAPSTSTRVYVRMSVAEHIASRLGSFDGGDRIASWLAELRNGHWLVAGRFDGG